MKEAIIVLMGVSGCGKSSVGRELAKKLGARFYDGDDFHSQTNITKMSQGIPLTDNDRLPWLAKLNTLIITCLATKQAAVIACSALKQSYRDRLFEGTEGVVLVYLRGSYQLILSRMRSRTEHFMQAAMLESQFEVLEEPKNALVVDIEVGVDIVVKTIYTQLKYCVN